MSSFDLLSYDCKDDFSHSSNRIDSQPLHSFYIGSKQNHSQNDNSNQKLSENSKTQYIPNDSNTTEGLKTQEDSSNNKVETINQSHQFSQRKTQQQKKIQVYEKLELDESNRKQIDTNQILNKIRKYIDNAKENTYKEFIFFNADVMEQIKEADIQGYFHQQREIGIIKINQINDKEEENDTQLQQLQQILSQKIKPENKEMTEQQVFGRDYRIDFEINPIEDIDFMNSRGIYHNNKPQPNYDQALRCFIKALEIMKTQEITNEIIEYKILGNIGYTLLNQGKFQLSKECLDKCLDLNPNLKQNNPDKYAMILCYLACIEKENTNQRQKTTQSFLTVMEILNNRYRFELQNVQSLNLKDFIKQIFQQFLLKFFNPSQDQSIDPLKDQARQTYIKALSSLATVYAFTNSAEKSILCFIRLLLLVCRKQQILQIITSRPQIFNEISSDLNSIIQNNFQWEFLLKSIQKYIFLLEYIKNKCSAEYLTIYTQTGYLFRQQGYEDKGLEFFFKALETIKEFGLQHKNREFDLHIAAGQVYRKKRDNQKAIEHFQTALRIAKQIYYAEVTKKWVQAKMQIAFTYNSADMEQEEQKCLNECLKQLQQSNAEKAKFLKAKPLVSLLEFNKHREKKQSVNKNIYKQRADYFYKQILKLVDLKKKNPPDQDLKDLLQIMSQADKQMEKYKQSIASMEEAINIGNFSASALNFIDLSSNLRQIGSLYYKLKDYDSALSKYREALECNLKNKGEQSVTVALIRNDIANMYWWKGNYQKAIDEYGKALKIREAIQKKDNKVTFQCAQLLESIAFSHDRNQSYQKALDFYQKALEKFNAVQNKGIEKTIQTNKKWINNQMDAVVKRIQELSSPFNPNQ